MILLANFIWFLNWVKFYLFISNCFRIRKSTISIGELKLMEDFFVFFFVEIEKLFFLYSI